MRRARRNGVLLAAPVALSTRQPAIPVFDCPTRERPFYAALAPARRQAYDHTARFLLLFPLLAEHHRAAHALWAGGVPVAVDTVPPRNLPDPKSVRKRAGKPEQAWYDAIQDRLCLAVLDLVILRRPF
ncbi:hypothetical protein DFH06DRAFT_1470651 [Mycena polygramma]|nr:hypothetical protein DFH06DRAFT_1470651 [Mycena polygramma]